MIVYVEDLTNNSNRSILPEPIKNLCGEQQAGSSLATRREAYAKVVYYGTILPYIEENLCARYNSTKKLTVME